MTIIERIANELARISPNTTIYTENQPNGFEEPCFFISRAGNTTLKPELFDYEVRKMPFQVVYFPPEENANVALFVSAWIEIPKFVHLVTPKSRSHSL